MTKDEDTGAQCSACGCGRGKWIWMGLAAAVLAVLLLKNPRLCGCAGNLPSEKEAPVAGSSADAKSAPMQATATGKIESAKTLPRLVDLGATKCIPCKMMAPILEDLRKTYSGQMDVQFIDVWENQDAGGQYGVKVIPTQIFFDAAGKELFRHEGFFAREDILAKWKELGVELQMSTVSDQHAKTNR